MAIFLWDIAYRPFRDFFKSAKHLANLFLWASLITFAFALLEKFKVAIFSPFSDIRVTFTFLIAYFVLILIKKYESGEWRGRWRKEHSIPSAGDIKRLKETSISD